MRDGVAHCGRFGAVAVLLAATARRWWHDRELAHCPQCGNNQLTPPSPSMGSLRICLTCGVVGEPEVS